MRTIELKQSLATATAVTATAVRCMCDVARVGLDNYQVRGRLLCKLLQR
jgi:hypothetical protein